MRSARSSVEPNRRLRAGGQLWAGPGEAEGGPGSRAALPVPAAPFPAGRAGPGWAGRADPSMTATAAEPSRAARLLSALLYGACSLLLVLLNKTLLTAYGFPSPIVLGIGQMAATIMILYVAKLNKIIHFPDFDKKIPVKLFPLPLLYVGNHLSGLSSTSKLSLPMFTVLRKFTIPLTLLLETVILGKQHSLGIVVSVFAIVLGAVVAAGSDLAFNLEGYVFVFLNDVFTAANGVYTKQKMDPKELGKYGVLFYNACFMIIPTFLISVSTGDLRQGFCSDGGSCILLIDSHVSGSFRWPRSPCRGFHVLMQGNRDADTRGGCVWSIACDCLIAFPHQPSGENTVIIPIVQKWNSRLEFK